MSADRIIYDSETGSFVFDNQATYGGDVLFHDGVAIVRANNKEDGVVLTAKAIGEIIGQSLICTEVVRFETVTVTINYLVEMLRFVRKHGWFCDLLSNTADHAFDLNKPTPGLLYGAARAIRAEIEFLSRYALGARATHLYSEAESTELKIAELESQVRQMTLVAPIATN